MLQSIRDSLGRWVAGIILGLLAVAFVFWGIDFSLTGANYAASVNGESIPLEEFERQLQREQSQYAELYRADLGEDIRRQIRANVLERIVRTEALLQHAEASGYRVSDERLMEALRSAPAFQIDGEFSMDLYQARLMNEGLSPAWFEARQRDALALTDLQAGISDSAFLTPAESRRYIELFAQRREIAYALFDVNSLINAEAITDEAIAAYYEMSGELYRTEERVDLEYVRLRAADLAGEVEVTDEDLLARFEQNRDAYQTQEERRARHILLTGDGAEARAEDLLVRIEAGEDFAELARELSADPGTRSSGGDLGWISRGMLVGPFEEALFSMEAGEVRGPVITNFGVHIIRLDEVRPATTRSFDDVRDELRATYQEQRAEELFYERATRLSDLAFDAYDELASVATQMNLPLSTLSGFSRSGDDSVFPNSVPVVQAAFTTEMIEQGINSGLVELAEDDVLVLRVTAHHPPVPRPLEEVRDEIRLDLARSEAQQRASAAATEFAAALESGADADAQGLAMDAPLDGEQAAAAPDAEDTSAQAPPADSRAALAERLGGRWVAAQWVSRTTADVPAEIIAAAFRMPRPAPGVPARREVALADGSQAVLILSGVQAGQPDMLDAEERETGLEQLAAQTGLYELSAYAEEVRSRASVRIPDQVLNPQPLY